MMKASIDSHLIYFSALDNLSTQRATSVYSVEDPSQASVNAVIDSTVVSLEAIRLAGAQLDSAFISIATDVVEEEDTAPISLTIESRQLAGLRYQGEIYRLIESFAVNHRLQAFCLGQTLSEQMTSYLITRSAERFAVWVNIRALPHHRYRHHLPLS